MRGNEVFAIGQRKIHLANHIDDLVSRLFKTDIDQHPLPRIVYKINRTAEPLSGLVVHLDDIGKYFAAGQHETSFKRSAGESGTTQFSVHKRLLRDSMLDGLNQQRAEDVSFRKPKKSKPVAWTLARVFTLNLFPK